jgi:hypothetical protein
MPFLRKRTEKSSASAASNQTRVAWKDRLNFKIRRFSSRFEFLVSYSRVCAALDGLVVSVLATEPTGYSVAGSNSTEDGGYLWVIKIPSAHYLRRGSKAVGPMS